MKNITRFIILVCSPLLLLLPLNAASASEFLGTFCWRINMVNQEPEEDTQYLNLGISHVGDGHFSVNGLITRQSGIPNNPMLLSGTAEQVGENVRISFHGAESTFGEDAETINIHAGAQVGPPLFNGVVGVNVYYYSRVNVTDPQPIIESQFGFLVFSECPAT
ncbi:MAG: hypothetical protein R3F41_13360 [Gammaproteobacteria bacterium]|nr:hypothetical protein [Pseudomonadales bacterium]MCP5349088.1 hypothetical protein [Pseudomonadales bacterium]